MKANAMSEFTNKDVTKNGKFSTFVLKMSAPIGPKTADVHQTHTFSESKDEQGRKIRIINIENKTLNFPYADYFNLIER
jgi:hypothetical protein